MNTKDRLDLIEKKMDQIMTHLGLHVKESKQEVQPKVDTTSLELELQKIINEIKVLKIRFRKIPMASPERQVILDALEELNQKKTTLQADLDATR